VAAHPGYLKSLPMILGATGNLLSEIDGFPDEYRMQA
jgi:hypothetical protein